MKRLWRPGITLAFFSPVLAELVSGSTPPLAFFFPITLPFFIFYYGVGVLIVRELSHRWRLPWPGLLLLGAAFGVTAEAFIAGTWVDVGSDAADIRWGTFAGLNWGIVFPFCLYHAVYSVGIPVLVVNRLFPDRAERSWVKPGRWSTFAVGLWVLFTSTFVVVRFDPLPTAIAFALITILVLFARRSRNWSRLASLRPRSGLRNRRLFLGSFGATLVIFAIGWWTRPSFPGAALMTNAVVLAMMLILIRGITARQAPDEEENHEKNLAMIGGAVTYLALQGAATELIGGLGMSLVGVATAIVMIRLWRREGGSSLQSSPPLVASVS